MARKTIYLLTDSTARSCSFSPVFRDRFIVDKQSVFFKILFVSDSWMNDCMRGASVAIVRTSRTDVEPKWLAGPRLLLLRDLVWPEFWSLWVSGFRSGCNSGHTLTANTQLTRWGKLFSRRGLQVRSIITMTWRVNFLDVFTSHPNSNHWKLSSTQHFNYDGV